MFLLYRYVDTFNKGVPTAPVKSVMGSLIPPAMPSGGMMSSPAMFVPGPVSSTTSFNESNNSDGGDSGLRGALRKDDASTSLGHTLSDTATSNPNMDVGLGYASGSAHPMMQVSTADNGLASFNAGSVAVLGSRGEPPMFGVAHTRSSSWSGYPSSFQNPLVPGEEDGFGASSFSGHDRRTGSGDMSHTPSMSVAHSSYANFYLPNGSGINTSMPPPLSGVPSAAGDIRDPSRQMMGQPFRGSQSDSLTGEDMQEVEL